MTAWFIIGPNGKAYPDQLAVTFALQPVKRA